MTIPLVQAPSACLSWRHPGRGIPCCHASGGRVREVPSAVVEEKTGRLVQLATAGVIAWDLAEIGRFFYIALLESPLHTIPWLAGALVIYLPLQLVLVRGAIRGERPRGSWWLLAGVALTLAVALPFGGLFMVLALWVPAALALLYFKPPWSLVLLAVVAAIAFIAALSRSLRSTPWMWCGAAWRSPSWPGWSAPSRNSTTRGSSSPPGR